MTRHELLLLLLLPLPLSCASCAGAPRPPASPQTSSTASSTASSSSPQVVQTQAQAQAPTALTSQGAIAGMLRGPDGRPVAGALVAAVPYDANASTAAGRAISDRLGRFRIDGLPAREYGVTATAPHLNATSRGPIAVTAGRATTADLTLGPSGPSYLVHIRSRFGRPLSGVELRAVHLNPGKGLAFYFLPGPEGYRVCLPTESYLLVANAQGHEETTQRLTVPPEEPRSRPGPPDRPERPKRPERPERPDQPERGPEPIRIELEPDAEAGPAPPEVLDWLRAQATRLDTVDAGHGLADLAPLERSVGAAPIVALGEATHGSSEFFRLKHRMLEFLVSEMGFTAIALEANFPEALDVNEYVLTGRGDPAKALAGMYFWTTNTEETLEMIRWMRRYNADPRHPKKVKFYGFDMQFAWRSVKDVVAYLRRVDPDRATAAARALALLANAYTQPDFDRLPLASRQATAAIADDLARAFDERHPDWARRTGEEAWVLARQHTRILQQNLAMSCASGREAQNIRDRAMAENAAWIFEHEGPGAKLVLWAASLHIATDDSGGYVRMGVHLRERFGRDLVTFGSAFHEGGLKAWQIPLDLGTGVLSFNVGAAPEGTLDETLARAGLERAAIDLRALPSAGPVAAWFGAPHLTRQIGSGYSSDGQWFRWRVAPRLWDAILYVARVTASHPLATDVWRFTVHERPTNLDFEETDGQRPLGWEIAERLPAFGYQVEASGERPQSGRRCVLLRSLPGRRYGEMFGGLEQHLDAKPYRGKRVRLRAFMRVEPSGAGGAGHLWLRAARSSFSPAGDAFYDGMVDRPITSGEWREYELTGEVPANVEQIIYGAALVGEGRAWVDAVSIEAVDRP